MRASLSVAVLAASAVTAAAGSPPKPAQVERNAFKAEVARLADTGDFKVLEPMHRSLVEEDPRYAGGISKLADFHTGLGMASDSVGSAPFLERRRRYQEGIERAPRLHLPKLGLAQLAKAEAWRASALGVRGHRSLKVIMVW